MSAIQQLIVSIPAPAAGGDPNFASVALLLHCEGTNGSTTFTDTSGTPKTITATGATISTARSKFGTASGLFAGNVHRLALASTITIPGDFTLEAQFYQTSASTNYPIIFSNTAGTAHFAVGLGGSGAMGCTGLGGANITSSTGVVPMNQWVHIAWVRSGSTVTAYVDGVSVASGTGASSFGVDLMGGLSIVNYSLNGNLDEIRITNGVARYTGNFTPPTAAFPDN